MNEWCTENRNSYISYMACAQVDEMTDRLFKNKKLCGGRLADT